jgi:hypothetical protein
MGKVSNRNEEKPMARELYYSGYGTKTGTRAEEEFRNESGGRFWYLQCV